jgi:hypothetical protein
LLLLLLLLPCTSPMRMSTCLDSGVTRVHLCIDVVVHRLHHCTHTHTHTHTYTHRKLSFGSKTQPKSSSFLLSLSPSLNHLFDLSLSLFLNHAH